MARVKVRTGICGKLRTNIVHLVTIHVALASSKVDISFTHATRERQPEAPTGLRGAAAGHPVGAARAWRRLPSEAELGRTFGASRITVGRAVRDLQRRAGRAARRLGHVRHGCPQAPAGLSFGLLIPDLGETEIFEPICQGMMASPLAREARARVGQPERRRELEGRSRLAAVPAVHRAPRFWRVLRAARVQAPPGRCQPADRDALDAARIPVVLLDRTVTALPGPRPPRSRRHRQSSRRLRRSPSTSCGSAAAVSRSSALPQGGRHSRRARGRLSGSAVSPELPSTAQLVRRIDPSDAPACAPSCGPRRLTPSSAPTTDRGAG